MATRHSMGGKIFVYVDHFKGNPFPESWEVVGWGGKSFGSAQHLKGKPLPASWEVVGAARKIAGENGMSVSALVLGQGVERIAQPAFQYGAGEVLLADDASLADYRP